MGQLTSNRSHKSLGSAPGSVSKLWLGIISVSHSEVLRGFSTAVMFEVAFFLFFFNLVPKNYRLRLRQGCEAKF